jgi:outer membrane lipoprotein-sorting protein
MLSRKLFPLRRVALALCVAGICAAVPASGADQLQAALDRMDQAAAKFKGLSAEVTKVSHLAVLNDDDDFFTGTIAVRRSKPHELSFVVDVLKPDPKKVRLIGHKLEMYYPKTNEKQIIDLDKKGSKLVDQFMLLGFGSTSSEIRSAYKVDLGGPETVAGQTTVRLVLTPKSPEVLAKLTRFELWISDSLGVAVQQKLWEPGDDYTLFTYTNVRLHAFPQELKWDVPNNAKPEKLN